MENASSHASRKRGCTARPSCPFTLCNAERVTDITAACCRAPWWRACAAQQAAGRQARGLAPPAAGLTRALLRVAQSRAGLLLLNRHAALCTGRPPHACVQRHCGPCRTSAFMPSSASRSAAAAHSARPGTLGSILYSLQLVHELTHCGSGGGRSTAEGEQGVGVGRWRRAEERRGERRVRLGSNRSWRCSAVGSPNSNHPMQGLLPASAHMRH